MAKEMRRYKTHTGLWIEIKRDGESYAVTLTGDMATKTLHSGDNLDEALSIYGFWRNHYEKRRNSYKRMQCAICGAEWGSESEQQASRCPQCKGGEPVMLHDGRGLAKEIKDA